MVSSLFSSPSSYISTTPFFLPTIRLLPLPPTLLAYVFIVVSGVRSLFRQSYILTLLFKREIANFCEPSQLISEICYPYLIYKATVSVLPSKMHSSRFVAANDFYPHCSRNITGFLFMNNLCRSVYFVFSMSNILMNFLFRN